MIVLQNAGIERTSVSHAALIVGAVPALVAIIAAVLRPRLELRARLGGLAVALAGVGLVAGGGGGGATLAGDALVLLSVAARRLRRRPAAPARRARPVAVTAVQMARRPGSLPVRDACSRALRPRRPAPSAVIAVLALALTGTAWPFALFAYGAVARRGRGWPARS